MNLIQPIENPNIPEELVKQITGVRNQITVGQAEHKRFTDLIASSKYEVNELVKQKVDLEDQIDTLSKKKDVLNTSIKELEKEEIDLNNNKINIDAHVEERMATLQKREVEINIIQKSVDSHIADLESKIEAFNSDLEAHELDKADFQKRVDKLAKALA